MKKRLFVFGVIIASVIQTANAQISIMPRVGVVISDVKLSSALKDGGDIKPHLGTVFGVSLNYKINDLFSIQPEANFINKGFKYEREEVIISEGTYTERNKVQIGIQYLEIPVLAKFSVGNDQIRAYFNLGPNISFGIGGKNKVEYSEDYGGNDIYTESFEGKVKFGEEPSNNEKDAYFDNSIDWGIQAGGGFGVKLGPGQLVLDFRYGMGLSNLFDSNQSRSVTDVTSKNRMFGAHIGYMIPLGGK